MSKQASRMKSIKSEVICDVIWRRCYDHGWNKNDLVADAFGHPAKLAKGLGFRIVEHAIANGWIKAGDFCVDPFGGIGGTALDAMWNGCHWIGCELEPRFVGLAQQNLDLWQRKYGSKPGFGSARILQGDSRKLTEIIAGADLVCSSPPYADQATHGARANRAANLAAAGIDAGAWLGDRRCTQGRSEGYGQSLGQLGAMKEGEAPRVDCVVSSPPYTGAALGHTRGAAGDKREATGKYKQGYTQGAIVETEYGSTPGQLESMPEGKFAAVVSSPPYAAIAAGAGGLNTKPGKDGQQSGRSPDSASQGSDQHYGESVGQLSGMAEGAFDAVVSSPPFERAVHGYNGIDGSKHAKPAGKNSQAEAGGYGETRGQLGNTVGTTFWQAARDIVAQCHHILRPGGMAIWICKDFVRKGKRVPFSDQWQALCEAQGFRLVCRHRAMLVAHHGEQDTIFGDNDQITTERKSFFRRLAEKKGSPPIDYEDVI